MFKNFAIVALSILGATSAAAQATTFYGVESEQIVCVGRNQGLPEFLTVDAITTRTSNQISVELTLTSVQETPDSWGVLFTGFTSALTPAEAAVSVSPICLTGPLVRSAPYLGDAAGTASITLTDLLPGETYFFQRAHRMPAAQVGTGQALKVRTLDV